MSGSLKYWLLGLIVVGALFLSWIGLRLARHTAAAVTQSRASPPPAAATNRAARHAAPPATDAAE